MRNEKRNEADIDLIVIDESRDNAQVEPNEVETMQLDT